MADRKMVKLLMTREQALALGYVLDMELEAQAGKYGKTDDYDKLCRVNEKLTKAIRA